MCWLRRGQAVRWLAGLASSTRLAVGWCANERYMAVVEGDVCEERSALPRLDEPGERIREVERVVPAVASNFSDTSPGAQVV